MKAQGVPESGWLSSLMTRADGFALMRYFTLTSLLAFAAVGAALFVFERNDREFFRRVQDEQAAFLVGAQRALAREHADAASKALLAEHEAGHVNLARLSANVLWQRHLAPLVARAGQFPVEHCRSLADGATAGTGGLPTPRQACFAELGRRIMSLPEFAGLDARAREIMKSSTVFKIKVFDLRGITVYSSEQDQIGEDKANNAGWRSAALGRPASELTRRDRFSAFEGVVEDRDLISSYLPVYRPGDGRIIAVFEIYSDVTPLLEQTRAASERIAALTEENRRVLEQRAQEDKRRFEEASLRLLAVVGGLLLILYLALLLLVYVGQRIIDRQRRAQAHAAERERQQHCEKMAAMATMAAAISHEVGSPLTSITLLTEEIAECKARGQCAVCQPEIILQQAMRIAQMTRKMGAVALRPGTVRETVDVNRMTKSICDFFGFDERYQRTPIEFQPTAEPAICVVVPDQLNEVLMNIVQVGAESGPAPARIRVATIVRGDDLLIRVERKSSADSDSSPLAETTTDPRIEAARRRVAQMNGQLSIDSESIQVSLPLSAAQAAPA